MEHRVSRPPCTRARFRHDGGPSRVASLVHWQEELPSIPSWWVGLVEGKAMHGSEADLFRAVRDLATWSDWLCYHTYDSRRLPEGFPDRVLARPQDTVIFAELKSMRGGQSAPSRPSGYRRFWKLRDLSRRICGGRLISRPSEPGSCGDASGLERSLLAGLRRGPKMDHASLRPSNEAIRVRLLV
jgi:hypothetical protein